MSIDRISIALVLTIIATNTVRCTPTTWDAVTATSRPKSSVSTLPVSSTHAALSEELLDALKKFHSTSSSPGKDSPTPAATPPIPPPTASNRISIMHFPAAPSSMNPDQSSRSSTNPGPLIPGQLHQLPFDLQMSDRGHNQISEPSLSQAPLQSRAPLPADSFPPTIADAQSSPAHVTPTSSRSTDPASLKIEPISLSSNSNQELIKLLTDLRISPASLQEPAATSSQNQIPGQTTHHSSTNNLQLFSPGSPNSARPILAPNQTPLDYLLSSSSPMHQINSINRQPPPSTDKPRPNLEFVKYLLTLPRYQQALNELIAAQSSTQT